MENLIKMDDLGKTHYFFGNMHINLCKSEQFTDLYRFPWNKEISTTKLPFGVTSSDAAFSLGRSIMIRL